MSEEMVFDLCCVFCGQSFLDGRHQVDGLPGLHLQVNDDGLKSLWLSPVYGVNLVVTQPELELEEGRIYELFCPHCGRQPVCEGQCQKCQAPILLLAVRGPDGNPLPIEEGAAAICSRFRCSNSRVYPDSVALSRERFLSKWTGQMVGLVEGGF